MERITNARLEAVATNLNRRLEGRRALARVVVERRYGYVAIDEADSDGQVRRTLTTGHTAREAYEALQNMIRALDLLPERSADRAADAELVRRYIGGFITAEERQAAHAALERLA